MVSKKSLFFRLLEDEKGSTTMENVIYTAMVVIAVIVVFDLVSSSSIATMKGATSKTFRQDVIEYNKAVGGKFDPQTRTWVNGRTKEYANIYRLETPDITVAPVNGVKTYDKFEEMKPATNFDIHKNIK